MHVRQPLQELTQCGLISGFENKVKMIRQQAKTKNLHPMTFLGVSQQSQKASPREFPKRGSFHPNLSLNIEH
jgi:hypothetical protein